MINIYAQTYMIATRNEQGSIVDAPRPGEEASRLTRFFSHKRRHRWDAPSHWLGVDRP